MKQGVKFGALCALSLVTGFHGRAQAAVRPLTLEQARAIAARDTRKPAFPIHINKEVLALINRWVASPAGRHEMRIAMERLDPYRQAAEDTFQRYRLPRELLAVAFVESSYLNVLPSTENGPSPGAGMWMFIRRTARAYGLKIGEGIDERLNIEKATTAAARYLSHLYQKFRDWPLALAAYNRGETYVAQQVASTGTRDAWRIDESDPISPYLDKAMAAAFVLRNPWLLNSPAE